MSKNNLNVQASEKVSYGSVLKGKSLHNNRDDYCLKQISRIIDDVIAQTGNNNPSILEIGFGDGRHMRKLSSIYKNASFTGLEVRKKPVDDMVELGYDCRLVETEEFNDFFKSGETFDIIFGSGVLHHMSDPYKSLESLIKLSKPGGTIYFTGEHHKYDLLSHLNAFIKKNWIYEKNSLKVKRKYFKEMLGKNTKTHHVGYDNNGLVICFERLNKLYCKLKMQKVPLWNCLTVFARVD